MPKKLLGGKLLVKDLKEFIINSYKNDPLNIGKFQYERELSDPEVQVYSSPNQIVVVHRGSVNLKDWFLNYKLFDDPNYKNKRINKSIDIINKVADKYPGVPITSIGHSLAGYLAALSDKVFEIIGLNSYIPKSKVGKNVSDKEYLIRSQLDVPSALSKTQKRKNVITIPAQTSNLLTEHSYGILNRLNEDTYIGREP